MYNSDSKTIIYLVGGSAVLADKLKEELEIEVFTVSDNTSEDYFLEVFGQVKQYIRGESAVNMIVVYKNSDYHKYGFLSGLLKTANQENPKLTGKTIGIDSFNLDKVEVIVEILEKEENTNDKEVRYRVNEREIKAYEKVTLTRGAPSAIKENGTYLITGGTGGIGLIFANYINSIKGTKVLLTGRSPLDKVRSAAINSLTDVSYHQVDVNDRNELEKFLKGKAINGIIHSAGLLRDSFIQNKSEIEIREVLQPKLQGVKNLDEVTKKDDLDFMVFFSSVASVMGNVGQSDYASANAFLDNYAHYRNTLKDTGQRKGHTLSINWSLWKDGGMRLDKDGQEYIEKQFGLGLLPTNDGIQAFEELLRSNVSQGVVTFGKENNIYNKLIRPRAKANVVETPVREEKVILEQPIVNNESSNLRELVAGEIVDLASKLLKLDKKSINIEKELGDYGFGSILLTKFSNELSNFYGVDLIPTVFYNYPTISDLTDHLLEEYQDEMQKTHAVKETEAKAAVEVQQAEVNHSKKIRSKRTTERTINSVKNESSATASTNNSPVAIIGVGGRLPGSSSLNNFWENIRDKKDLISEVPKDRWDWKAYFGDPKEHLNKTKAKWGGFIDDIDKFDSLFFSISPREAELMDPQQRIALEAVYSALEDAGITSDKIKGTDTGVFIGASSHDYAGMISMQKELSGLAQFSTGTAHSVLANRISYLLDIHGPSEPIDTACSSSLIAIHRAVENIRSGSCDMAIAGGVNAILSPDITLSFSQAGMLSDDGRCKTFDQRANGYVRGEGVGMIVLKNLEQAKADGDQIYGVIKGSSENHGGKANTMTSPNPIAQKRLLLKAYQRANVDPRDISYIEAHGTGTPLGDPIEIDGLKSAFSELYKEFGIEKPEMAHCGIGSVKTNIGHLEAAAGIAGVLKVVYALKHKTLPGNPNLKEPNEYLKLDNSPFYLQQETTPWDTKNGKPRIAGVSSFGFGGANAHVIVEEYQQEAKTFQSDMPAIVVISARDKDRLKEQVLNLSAFIEQNRDTKIHDIAYTLQKGRNAMEQRLAFLASTSEEALEVLNQFLQGNKEVTFSGNIKAEQSNFLLNGGAGEAYINYAIEHKEGVSLAQLWVKGIEIDWDLLYVEDRPAKISLPTYPFARERHWISEDKNIYQFSKKKEIKIEAPIVESLGMDSKEVIRGIFSEVLKIDAAIIQEDTCFEALGLDSILIHSVLQELKKHSFPIAANVIWEYNTVGELSKYLDSTKPVNGSKSMIQNDAVVANSLIAQVIPFHVEILKEGDTKLPTFIVPGSPGVSSPYSDLAECVKSESAIYGLNWKGVMEGEEPFQTMEEIVKHNIQLIDEVSSGNEPIQLIGHSYGALIVYEMLKYYSDSNKEVRNVLLIDSSPKILNTKFREKEKMVLFLKSITYNQGGTEQQLDEIATKILKKSKSMRLASMLELLNANEMVKPSHNELIKRLFATYYSALGIKYTGKKIQLPYTVNVIKAEDDTVINDSSEEQGWGEYFTGVDAKIVKGDHFSMVKNPLHLKWIENVKWN